MRGGLYSATLAMFIASTNAWAIDAIGAGPTSQFRSSPVASVSPLTQPSGVGSTRGVYFENAPCPAGGARQRPLIKPAHRRSPARNKPVQVPTAFEQLKARIRPRRISMIPSRPTAPTHCEILHQGPLASAPEAGPALMPVVDAALEPAALVLPEGGLAPGGGAVLSRSIDNGPGGGESLPLPGPPIGGGPPIIGGGAPSPRGGGVSAAPEPGAWVLMLAGVAMLGGALRRRRQAGADLCAGTP